jgi:hypothetical protein
MNKLALALITAVSVLCLSTLAFAGMSASASLFIIHSSLTLVKHSVYKLSTGAIKPASPPNSSNESIKSQKNKTKLFPNVNVGQTLHHVIPQINKDFPHNLLIIIVDKPIK